MTPLKDYILQNCFTKDGRLNNRCCTISWWDNRNVTNIFRRIVNQTSFLNDNCLFSERIYCIVNDITSPIPCQQCNRPTNFKSYSEGHYTYCSLKCSNESEERSRKIVENTDRKQVINSMKQTNLEKYGVEHYVQTKEFTKKSKRTKKKKYGNENYNNTKQMKQTNLEKYGVEYSFQAPEVIDKIQDKKTKKLPMLRNKDWLISENKTKSIQEIANDLNVAYKTVYMWYKKYDIDVNFFNVDYSKQQKQVANFIESLGITNIVLNDRNTIKPKELDIHLPEYNLAIEYNGMYWHSEDKHRHLNKLNSCIAKSIDLIQIWDTEWLQKPDIVKSIIKNKLGLNEKIYARKCSISSITYKDFHEFLELNHIQGSVNASIRYGLYYERELVAVIGLGKSRFDKKYSHELLRFCNGIGINVIGGFSRLLKHVIEQHDIDSIQTFADRRLFNGSSYEKLGFTFSHTTTPGYVYYKKGVVKNRQEFQKHKLKKVLHNFDENLSEYDNVSRNGWLKVWDCGQLVYSLKVK